MAVTIARWGRGQETGLEGEHCTAIVTAVQLFVLHCSKKHCNALDCSTIVNAVQKLVLFCTDCITLSIAIE